MYRVSPFVRRFGFSLIAGVALATLWVNLHPASYYDMIEWRVAVLSLPDFAYPDPFVITPLHIVSDGLMALFLFFLGKELWESIILSRGALSGTRAIVPMGALAGGWMGAIAVWVLAQGSWQGWTLPLGSDVVLGYMVARVVFGAGHPAVQLTLLLTIAMEIFGLFFHGLAYPPSGLRLYWLALPALGVFTVWAGFARHARAGASEIVLRRAFHVWPYAFAGLVSWLGVVLAGLPGALGLLPVIPVIPHADRAFGLFAEAEELLHDPLNRMAHLLVKPLGWVLFLFGLTRGGVDFGALGPISGVMLLALWLGKPLGLFLGALLAARLARQSLPQGIRARDLVLCALITGVAFTVPVLALDTALAGGRLAEGARVGLAFSLAMGVITVALSRMIRR